MALFLDKLVLVGLTKRDQHMSPKETYICYQHKYRFFSKAVKREVCGVLTKESIHAHVEFG